MIDLNNDWLRKETATPSVYYGYSNTTNPSETDNVWAIRKVTTTGATDSVTWANGVFSFVSKWSERTTVFATSSTPIGITYSTQSDRLNIYWNRIPGVDRYVVTISEGGVVYNYLGYPDQNIHRPTPITIDMYTQDSAGTQSYIYKFSTTGKTYSVTIAGSNIVGSTSSSVNINT